MILFDCPYIRSFDLTDRQREDGNRQTCHQPVIAPNRVKKVHSIYDHAAKAGAENGLCRQCSSTLKGMFLQEKKCFLAFRLIEPADRSRKSQNTKQPVLPVQNGYCDC